MVYMGSLDIDRKFGILRLEDPKEEDGEKGAGRGRSRERGSSM
jgi:hypothetical protein